MFSGKPTSVHFEARLIRKLLQVLPIIVVFGCSSGIGPSSLPTATLIGRVHLLSPPDALTSRRDTLHRPVTVFIPAIGASTFSDSNGRWSLSNVPFGSYDIYATASGYDTLAYWGVVSSGDSTHTGSANLSPNPTRKLYVSSVAWSNNPGDWPIMIKGTIDTEVGYNDESDPLICFLDTTPNVPAKSIHLAAIFGQADDSTWSASTEDFFLDTLKFHPGMKLFVTACMYSLSGLSDGIDFNPHTQQSQVVSPGRQSEPFITIYPW